MRFTPSQLAAPHAPADLTEETPAIGRNTRAHRAHPARVSAACFHFWQYPAVCKTKLTNNCWPIFLEEALDLNLGISNQLRAWRNDPSSAETVRTLTRLLHTLKGSARMAGAMNLGQITHAIETRVEEANRAGAIAPEAIDEIDSAFDDVLQIIERLQSGETLDETPVETTAGTEAASPCKHPETASVPPATPALPERERRTDRFTYRRTGNGNRTGFTTRLLACSRRPD